MFTQETLLASGDAPHLKDNYAGSLFKHLKTPGKDLYWSHSDFCVSETKVEAALCCFRVAEPPKALRDINVVICQRLDWVSYRSEQHSQLIDGCFWLVMEDKLTNLSFVGEIEHELPAQLPSSMKNTDRT